MLKTRRETLFSVCCAVAFPFVARAADVDGTWLLKRTTQKGEVELELELKLKADGDALTGTYGRKGARRANPISDGKIDGDEISFSTVQRTKKGESKILWKATISGSEMNGESGREGRRMRELTAQKQ